jgi:hypothetical protein
MPKRAGELAVATGPPMSLPQDGWWLESGRPEPIRWQGVALERPVARNAWWLVEIHIQAPLGMVECSRCRTRCAPLQWRACLAANAVTAGAQASEAA